MDAIFVDPGTVEVQGKVVLVIVSQLEVRQISIPTPDQPIGGVFRSDCNSCHDLIRSNFKFRSIANRTLVL